MASIMLSVVPSAISVETASVGTVCKKSSLHELKPSAKAKISENVKILYFVFIVVYFSND